MPEHEGRIPTPRTGHHQDRRCRKVRQRAADRDVHEEQPQRRVLQPRRRLEVEKLTSQQQSADGHRSGFGDERPKQGADHEDRDPPRSRSALAQVGQATQTGFRKRDDRSRGGERHHDDHEERFSIGDAVVHVVAGRVPAGVQRHGSQEDERPQAKDHLDFSEEVEQLGYDAWRGRTSLSAIRRVMSVLQPMGRRGHARRGKGVGDRQQEDGGRDPIEGFECHSGEPRLREPGSDHIRIVSQRSRQLTDRGRGDGVSHLPTLPHGPRRAGHLLTAVMSADAPATRPTG